MNTLSNRITSPAVESIWLSSWLWISLFPALILWLCATVGCGNSGFGTVTGRVTLGGDPLENAFVEFLPGDGQGSTSSGRTDKRGEYSLSFSRSQTGALVGKHRVRITTRDIATDETGVERWLPEKVPKRYNAQTELVCEVNSGSNRRDFELEPDKP